jgi:hypothetical protein
VGRFKVVLVIDESPIEQNENIKINSTADSFLATAGDLIGCLDELPPYLSHNKQYFEGFAKLAKPSVSTYRENTDPKV